MSWVAFTYRTPAWDNDRTLDIQLRRRSLGFQYYYSDEDVSIKIMYLFLSISPSFMLS